ncbi:MAG: s-layer domain-containing protein [Candidatus Peregrinibacteria bacterium GW2011_GWF2_39_17]|nr:MAG: s-layer domain-containing protein [Candidatus Peregrinibacteria bacterium GW2011_GWF2_39_17]HCW32260.1 hypothetical protein [Candidatus Peregrinibacteria bacterium]
MVKFSFRQLVFVSLSTGFFLVLFGISVQAASFNSAIYTGAHFKYAIDTVHFTIEFGDQVKTSLDNNSNDIPDLVEEVSEYAEFSFEKEVNDLGFPTPLNDQPRIFLLLDEDYVEIGSDAYGISYVFDDGSVYMAIDPWLTSNQLAVTIAHEFLHCIQFSYLGAFAGFPQDVFFSEQTAVWAEEAVYPEINDYWYYLTDFFNYPEFSIFTGQIPADSLFEYASAIWPIFLSEYFDDWHLGANVVNNYFIDSNPDVWDAFEAYEKTLRVDYSASISDLFQDFAVWNYLPDRYTDGINYPEIYIEATHESNEYPLNKISVENAPELFGSNYLKFKIDSNQWGQQFQLNVNKPAEVEFRLIFIPETSSAYLSDQIQYSIIEQNVTTGNVSVIIADGISQYTLIVLPVSNDPMSIQPSDAAFEELYPYTYSAKIVEADAPIDEIDDFPTEVITTAEDVPVDFSDPELNADSLTVSGLTVTSKSAHTVSLKWNRVLGSEVAGYYIYYGVSPGFYYYVQTVEESYLTYATINNLLSGTTYYFAVTAYTKDYQESEIKSNEVEAILPLAKFSDVPPAHFNYQAIEFLTYIGVINGYSDNTFRPSNGINRAELMKILVFTELGYEPDKTIYHDCFSDVNEQWFAPSICYAFEQGWVKGYDDGLFHPANSVTKAEALKMILEAANVEVPTFVDTSLFPFTDVYGAAWYAPYVEVAYQKGFLEEEETMFNPNQPRTRAAVVEEIFRSIVVSLMETDVYNDQVLADFVDQWPVVFQ